MSDDVCDDDLSDSEYSLAEVPSHQVETNDSTVCLPEHLSDALDYLAEHNFTAGFLDSRQTCIVFTFPLTDCLQKLFGCSRNLSVVVRYSPNNSPPRVGLKENESGGVLWEVTDYNESALWFVKPFLLAVQNDLDVIWNKPDEDAALATVWESIGCKSENFKGVFELNEDMDKEVMVRHIVGTIWGITSSANIVRRAADVVMCNVLHFGQRCHFCGSRHEETAHELVPWACCNDLCRFRVCELANGTIHSQLHQRPEAIELLIVLALTACSARRAEHIFTPAPLGLTPGQVQEVIECIPPLRCLMACKNEAMLRETANKADKRCYGILCWLVSNIPSYIQLSSWDQMVAQTGSPNDAELITCFKPTVFKISGCFTSLARYHRAHRAQYGWTCAFHGSRVENWYSILKHGPRNMSQNATYMLHGKVHGDGVYLSRKFALSHAYSMSGNFALWPGAALVKKFTAVVGVCEISNVESGDGVTDEKKRGIVVVPDSRRVSVQYLILV